MKELKPQHKKRKRAIREVRKSNLKNAHGFVKFSRFLGIFLKILAILIAIGHSIYILTVTKEPLDFILLLITAFMPFLVSYAFDAVYWGTCSGTWHLRLNERLKYDDETIIYSYSSAVPINGRYTTYVYTFKKSEVSFKHENGIVLIKGNIIEQTYNSNRLAENELLGTEEWSQLEILDQFDFHTIQ